MKINKYNKPKDTSTSRSNNTTIIYGSGAGSAGDGSKLSETHLIFGLPFNGTLDVAGDLSNVQNINAVGGDITVTADDGTGGNITADGTITAASGLSTDGNLTVDGAAEIGNLTVSENTTTNSLNSNLGDITTLSGDSLTYDDATLLKAVIDALSSIDITTENLTVTKLAHFFQLIIDKIKAAGGAVILSPADGFKIDLVEKRSTQYRLYWKATDGDKSISNMWLVGDLAICLTFNAAEGTSYSVSNKYYWAVVLATGTVTKDDDVTYHYIQISTDDYDGTLNPEEGDEIAMLGSRTDDVNRQSAIYISAYTSVDDSLQAPLFCHYKGINDYNLSSHKYTWFAANGNTIRGSLLVESGEKVEDIVSEPVKTYLHTAYANSADGKQDFSKTAGDYTYLGLCSNTTESDSNLTYSDYIWSRIKGTSITITSKSIEYAVSSSGTTAPTSGWSSSIKTSTAPYYLWTRTTINYSDGTSTVSYSVSRISKDGDTGTSITITSTSVLYAASDSGVTAPSDWSDSIPTVNEGLYLWTKTTVTYSDNTTTVSYSVAKLGNNGTSVTITSKSILYVASTSGTTIPTSGWSSTIPSVAAGRYLWTKTTVNYSDGTSTVSYSVARLGANGTSVTISSLSVEYAVSNSGTVIPTSGWSTTIPAVGESLYLWTRTTVTYSDGTSTISYSVSRNGANGDSGASFSYNLLDDTNNGVTNWSFWSDPDSYQCWDYITSAFDYRTGAGFTYDSTLGDKPTAIALFYKMNPALIKNGRTYTVSFRAVNLDNIPLTISVRYKNGTNAITTSSKTYVSNGRVITTITGTADGDADDSQYFYISVGDSTNNVSDSFGIGDLKLEYGEVENPVWTKSLNDILGADADYYKLIPVNELALVDANGNLSVALRYQISHIVGTSATTVTAKSDGFFVRFRDNQNTTYTNLSYSSTPLYSNAEYQTDYLNLDNLVKFIRVELRDATKSSTVDTRIIPVTVAAGAVFEIGDSIKATVMKSVTEVDGKVTTNTNNIATLQADADTIKSTVESHTTDINALSDSVTTNTTNISTLTQTALSLTSTVSKLDSTNLITGLIFSDPSTLPDTYPNLSMSYSDGTYTASFTYDEDSDEDLADFISYTSSTIRADAGEYLLSLKVEVPEDVRIKLTYISTYTNILTLPNGSTRPMPVTSSGTLISSDDLPANYNNTVITQRISLGDAGTVAMVFTPVTQEKSYYVKIKKVTLSPYTATTSLIEQTAELIKLLVLNVSLKIDEKKIVLDGDTEINGSLVLDDTNLGFILNGSGGTTQISPLSIGTYSKFSSKSTNVITKTASIPYDVYSTVSTSSTYSFTVENTQSLGSISSGTYITLGNSIVSALPTTAVTLVTSTSISSVKYELIKDSSTVVKSITLTSANNTSSFITYTSTGGSYTVRVTVSGTINTSKNTSSSTTPALSSSTVSVNIRYDVTLPTSAYMLIGYDGLAINFGNLKTVYLGSEGTYITYNNLRFKINENGIYKYAGSTTSTTMTGGAGTDTVASKYVSEYSPINGCNTRLISAAGTAYLKPNDEFIVASLSSGTLYFLLGSPATYAGRKLYFKKRTSAGTFYICSTATSGGSNTIVTLNSNTGSLTNAVSIGNIAYMAISDGTYWNLYYCG